MSVYKNITLAIGNTDFTVVFSGKYGSTDDTWCASNHTHSFTEMHIMHTGRVRLNAQNRKRVFSENNVCVIPPGVYHAIEPITKIIRKTSVYLEIKRNSKKTEDTYTQFSKLFESDNPAIYKFSSEYLIGFIKTLDSYDAENAILNCKIQNLFSLILAEIYEQISVNSPLDEENDVTGYTTKLRLEIEDFLEITSQRIVTEEALAKHLNISTTQLRRLVRKHFRCTVRTLVLEHKIEIAKELIKKDELTMNEIATHLGYETYSGFYRSFKSLTGLTPEEYRTKKQMPG